MICECLNKPEYSNSKSSFFTSYYFCLIFGVLTCRLEDVFIISLTLTCREKELAITNLTQQLQQLKAYVADTEQLHKPQLLWRQECETLNNQIKVTWFFFPYCPADFILSWWWSFHDRKYKWLYAAFTFSLFVLWDVCQKGFSFPTIASYLSPLCFLHSCIAIALFTTRSYLT